MNTEELKVGLAQIAPVWLNRKATLSKVNEYIEKAGKESCQLVAFGEALCPGYPFWLELTGGATFNSSKQKEIFALYSDQAVQVERGDLDVLRETCATLNIATYLGIIERPSDRGGHSLYASIVYIDALGEIRSIHRKLMPTYEERLAWSPGDGHGLVTHKLGPFTVGGLNCWENWMPLPRTTLYAKGEDLHVAIWPGSKRNTDDITRHIAKEGRSFVISVSGLMRKSDIGPDLPFADEIRNNAPEQLTDGGSCLSAPDGSWVIEPQLNTEGLFTATINHKQVRMERQNFDPVGHYSRPDVFELKVNEKRQGSISQ